MYKAIVYVVSSLARLLYYPDEISTAFSLKHYSIIFMYERIFLY